MHAFFLAKICKTHIFMKTEKSITMKIFSDINKNLHHAKSLINSDDFIIFNFKTADKNAVAIYLENLCDKEVLGKQAIYKLSMANSISNVDDVTKNIDHPEVTEVYEFNEVTSKLLNGDGVIFVDGLNTAVSVATKKVTMRAITEPPTSSVMKGPREGFVENIQTNLALIRNRLRTENFCYKKFTVGKYSKTLTGLVYLKGVANEKTVQRLSEKLKNITVDGIIDSSYVIKCISDRKTSLFREVGATEKPDILCAKLLEGRIGIIVDGSPIILTAPFLLLEDFQNAEDYYSNVYRANVSRFLRLISVIIAVMLPAFFVASQLFHLQFIPLNFLLTIVSSIKGIPLSPSVEMFFTLLIFELLNEASLRMPRYVGIAMSVVGALVLGETAVNAGIVSTPTIMIVALSGICLYTIPDMIETLSVLRIMFLVVAGAIGAYGIILLFCALITYLASLDSFGTPYLAPYSPLILRDLQDGFTLSFFAEQKRRPKSIKSSNVTRRRFNLDEE